MSSGLLSTGKEGAWSVDIMEDSETEQTVFSILVQSPSVCLQFNLEDLALLDGLSRFLRADGTKDRWFELQNCLGGDLAFVFHDGGFWIRLIMPGAQIFKVSFDRLEATSLCRALDDALQAMSRSPQTSSP